MFIPIWGSMIQFDKHFSDGWFNHQVFRRRQAYLVLSGAISVIGVERQGLAWKRGCRRPFFGEKKCLFSGANLLLVSGSVSKIPNLNRE